MVAKKNFGQNGKNMHHHQRGGSVRGGLMPYKKPPYKPGGGGGAGNSFMFNASQIPDNAEYVDFSLNPPPMPMVGGGPGPGRMPPMAPHMNNNKKKLPHPNAATPSPHHNKTKNNNNKKPAGPPINTTWTNANVVQNNQRKPPPHEASGRPTANIPPNTRFHGQRGRPGGPFSHPGAPGRGGGRRMMGPRFQAVPPMIPPMPPMMGAPGPHLGPPPPPYHLRRNMPPMPPPMIPPPRMPRGHMMPPGGPMPPGPFNGKVKKPAQKVIAKKIVKGKSTIKTLKNLVNQYPLDKPWVTDAIKAEHAKKVDIEERLKGNKDDELFAQFKTQRDLFVEQYEKAREEYLKKEAEAVKAKDEQDKQTCNTQTAENNGNSNKAEENANA